MDDLIVWGMIVYVIVASIIFFLYEKRIFHECATFEPTSEDEFKKFYKKQIFKALMAFVLLLVLTFILNFIFHPGEIIDMQMKG